MLLDAEWVGLGSQTHPFFGMLARMRFAGVDVRIAAVSAPEATVGEPLTAFATVASGGMLHSASCRGAPWASHR